jgi:hypothetical protein
MLSCYHVCTDKIYFIYDTGRVFKIKVLLLVNCYEEFFLYIHACHTRMSTSFNNVLVYFPYEDLLLVFVAQNDA